MSSSNNNESGQNTSSHSPSLKQNVSNRGGGGVIRARRPKPDTEQRLINSLSQTPSASSDLLAAAATEIVPAVPQPSADNRNDIKAKSTQSFSEKKPSKFSLDSRLRVNAAEFVPRFQAPYAPETYTGQENNRSNNFTLSSANNEYTAPAADDQNYPDAYNPNVPYYMYDPDSGYGLEDFGNLSLQEFNAPYTPEQQWSSGTNGSRTVLDRFKDALRILNLNPGNMEEYLRPICQMIKDGSGTDVAVSDVVESLFNQSICEPNFRYTGARICQYLNQVLKNNPQFADFLKIFAKRCQKEFERREELKNGPLPDQERLRGLALFMAEIFVNVETKVTDGTVERISFLPRALTDCVRTLLSLPSELNVKCSCQLLKLAGGLVEDVVKQVPEYCVKFEDIFTILQSLQSNPSLTQNIKLLIGSVLTMKNNNWNRTSISPPKAAETAVVTDPNNFQVPDAVFYTQSGLPCSRVEAGFPEDEVEDGTYILNEEEEAAFLTWQAERESLAGNGQQMPHDEDAVYNSFPLDEAAEEGDMGDEMEAAYEEFLLGHALNHLHSQPATEILPQASAHSTFNQHHQPPHVSSNTSWQDRGHQQQYRAPQSYPAQQQQLYTQGHQQQQQYAQGQQQQYAKGQQQQQYPPGHQQQQYPSGQQQQYPSGQQQQYPSGQQQQYPSGQQQQPSQGPRHQHYPAQQQQQHLGQQQQHFPPQQQQQYPGQQPQHFLSQQHQQHQQQQQLHGQQQQHYPGQQQQQYPGPQQYRGQHPNNDQYHFIRRA